MFFRYLLIFIAVILAIRIIRGVLAYLFPPADVQGKNGRSSHVQGNMGHKIDYKDVKDAKFKDL
ncbi:MAG TPA: hypothetical protein VNL36_05610 [Bacteroidota bacterium]|nr:hypothetical protein [Bacteroidota bacterium]